VSSEEITAIAGEVSALRASGASAVDAYVEVPIASDPTALIAAIASHKQEQLRAKVRTGGVEPGAFPTAEQVTRFIFACAAHDVTFKATAGLHHAVRGNYPLTYDRESERGVMFGFLNVFLAALFVRDGLDHAATVALLEERDPGAFAFSATGVTWRGRTVNAPAIRASREQRRDVIWIVLVRRAGGRSRGARARLMAASRLDATHDPALKSWIESANDGRTDFPIQKSSVWRVSPRL